jgi:hypothetical protein
LPTINDGNEAGYGGATCPPSGQYCNSASAGIWMSASSNTGAQNNEVYRRINGADGTGFDVDWGNHSSSRTSGGRGDAGCGA